MLALAGTASTSTVLVHSTPAQAAPDPMAAARTQFQQGLALETAGDWAGALALFQQVAAVKLTPQVRFNIALCEEHLGRLAIALGDYRIAASEADAAKAADVAALVEKHQDELRNRIPKVVIKRGEGGEYASVTLDGISLGSSSVGSELPVDPGPHTITAKAPGYKPFTTSFNMAEKESKTVELTLEKIIMAADPTADMNTGSAATPGNGGAEKPAEPPHKPNRLLPIVVGSVGVASLITSGIFFALRSGTIKDLNNGCGADHNNCPTDLQSTYNKGKTYNTVADVTLGVGIVGVAAGTVLFLLQKKPAPAVTKASITFVPSAPDAQAGASLFARF